MNSEKKDFSPKTIKKHLIDNKGKISLFLLGYLMFALNQEEVEGFKEIFSSISGLSFFISYFIVLLITYIYTKIAVKFYLKLKLTKKPFTKENLKNGFYIISIGAFLGFLINIINALIIVIFSNYIG